MSIPPFTDEYDNIQDEDDIILNRNSHYRLKPYAKHLYQKERLIDHYSQLTKLDKEIVKVAFREAMFERIYFKSNSRFYIHKNKIKRINKSC